MCSSDLADRPAAAQVIAAAQAAPPSRPPLALRPALGVDAPPPKLAPTRAPDPAPPAPPEPSHAGGEAQIVAAPSEALARQALAQLSAASPAAMNGLSTRVERIERGGKAYYRALVYGFAAPASAGSFCRQITATGRACITR